MEDLISSIIVTLIGFILGGIILTIIGAFSIKFFIRRIVKELTNEEAKSRFTKWIEDVLVRSLQNSLKDKKVRKLIVESLELAIEKFK